VTYARNIDAVVVADYVNAKRAKKSKRAITQRWQLPPGIGVEGNGDLFTLVSGNQRRRCGESRSRILGHCERSRRIECRLVHWELGRKGARCSAGPEGSNQKEEVLLT
jgi:hypothetical protein